MKYGENELGKIEISDTVIKDVAIHAYMEFNGLDTNNQKKKKEARGKIEVETDEGEEGINAIKITVNTRVKYGESIPEYCRQLQKKIKEDVENFSGIKVDEVFVRVSDIFEEVVEEQEPSEEEETEE
ncbi:MAG: Asp23/Gls24 family envelope stress response protein [Thermotogota bacterium]|nr:Asp23/Gls24 family envelope stress response protein [Thermotogota bacterium]